MALLRNISIRYKLTLVLVGVVSVVLLAVSVANVVSEMRSTRTNLENKYATLAAIVAAQSSAALSIADIDPSGAQQILSDLAVEPSIRVAALVDANGHVVASYSAAGETSTAPTIPLVLGTEFTDDGQLDVLQSVRLAGGETIGRLYLRASTDALDQQILRTVGISAIVYVMALAASVLLSFLLQRLVSTPLLRLAQLARRVSTEYDYSLVAEHRGKDELGRLCEDFNSMLNEIRRRDSELGRSNDELIRSNDELRQFAFVASHDLQEPLRTMMSFCNVLREECDGKLHSEADACVERIIHSAQRMRTLVADLLTYSRVTRDEQSAFADVDLHNALADALANLQGSIEASEAVISFGQLPVVSGNRTQLVQLLQNLIGNAILYRGDEPPRIRIGIRRNGDKYEVSVQDNGIGIAAEHHERIFEIFKRLHGRDRYPGTGIGLAVCRKIVERHGGRIWVDSRSGEGSTFRFTIYTSIPSDPSEKCHERSGLAAAV
jgi:signal transduction histidine kinase